VSLCVRALSTLTVGDAPQESTRVKLILYHHISAVRVPLFWFFHLPGRADIVLFFALTHFFIVSASIVQPGATAPLLEFNSVFDPTKDSQAAFMNMVTNFPNFVAEEWSHVLTWDLFVGRWIWLDGLKRGTMF
jgi:Domain of unknown function (DUF4281)